MQLDETEDQAALRQSVRSVLERECPMAEVRALVEARVRGEDLGDGGIDHRLWRTTAALDWPALTVPEAHGGIGLGFVEVGILAEELGRVLAPGPLVPTLTQLTPAVRVVGDTARLAAIAAGTLTGSLAVAERHGWSLDGVAARAVRAGGGWDLTGRKDHVMEVGAVDVYAAVVREQDGFAIALIPSAAAVAEPVRSLDPTRRFGSVVLDGIHLEASKVHLVDAGTLTCVVEEATIAVALDLVGCCQSIFDTTIAYARDRVQFGVPIGSFQAVKHKLVNMFVSLERARATAYFALACVAEDDQRRALAAAMAKAAAGDCQRLVASDGIQLLGGIGYTWEHDQHLFVTRAKADEALFGSANDHRRAVAAHLGF